MISSTRMNQIAYKMAQAFEEINDEYIELMAKHVKDMGKLSATDMHRLEQMNKMDANIAHINKKLRQQCNLTVLQLDKLYKESGLSLYDDMDVFYSAKGVEQVPFEQNRRIQEYIQSVNSLTYGTFENLSRTTAISENYRKVVDTSVYAVSSGLENYQSAIRKTLVKASTDGMRVKYASGYTRRLDSAVRMNILEGVRQVNLGIRQITGEQFGADGYEISAHGLCAKDHQDIQGKQFSLKQFNKLQQTLQRPIGTLNCQHTAYPIVLGISQPAYSNEELKDMLDYSNERIQLPNGKEVSRYEASQLMRKLETNIRYAKDSFIAGKASGDDVIINSAKAKIKRNKELYSNIANKSGLQERPERMGTVNISGIKKVSIAKNVKVTSKVTKDSIKNNLQMYVGGGYSSVKQAVDEEEFEWIKKNMKKTSNKLYRVENSKFTVDKFDLDDGSVFSFEDDLRSFTRDGSYAGKMLDPHEDIFDSPVIFETVGDTKHFNMDPYSEAYYENQSESLVGGKFKVIGWEDKLIKTPHGDVWVEVYRIKQL